MADAMVTARMASEKKEAGNRILEQLGTNSSQVVNRLYDYVIENKKLPFPGTEQRRKITREELAEAIAWVDSIPRLPKNNRFANITDDEIRYERLASRGHFEDGRA
ncbi:type II toxin-antitoxin system RelB/DinJ family antitoxin [Raoultibacter phocaeensis]|uniref:type II toxin-antitoxin system RelB/DinJ family antitoxin n=1 Tax=Raoultibacter phocaeensis TaxID=2479841 RepID=UPI00111AC558|nr:type II toxin-antitoxin system RelB/DinJ family antitoxin [Raoultibacter phocaeensis]